MAKCKFCGKSVGTSVVFHNDCWIKEMERVAETFCDKFCRWPDICKDEEELDETHCNNDCPIIQMLNVGC